MINDIFEASTVVSENRWNTAKMSTEKKGSKNKRSSRKKKQFSEELKAHMFAIFEELDHQYTPVGSQTE